MAEDGGILDEVSWDGSMTSSCSDTSSSWRVASATHAEGTTSEDWNQLDQNGSNDWRYGMYFPNRPESIFEHDCRDSGVDYRPWPRNFQYSVEIQWDEDDDQLYFTHPEPDDGDGDSGNSELSLALDILGGAGGFFVNAGAAVIDYLIGGSGASFTENSPGSYSWDIPLAGDYDDLPHEESKARSAEVKNKVHNEYASGTHGLSITQSYTFGYYTDESGDNCRCLSPISTYKKTATTKLHEPEFDVA